MLLILRNNEKIARFFGLNEFFKNDKFFVLFIIKKEKFIKNFNLLTNIPFFYQIL
jgi:hypothetical protein